MNIKRKEFWIKSDNKKIFCILEEPNKSNELLIILFHGLTNSYSTCPLIEDTSHLLQENGFSTLRFDYYGSGKSDGEFKDKTLRILVQNTKDIFNYSKSKLSYKKIGLWGRSFGAMLGATICDYPSIFVTVLISTTTHTHISLSSSFPKGQLYSLPIIGTAIVKGEPKLPKVFYEKTAWLDTLQEKHLEKAKNVLIIQGTEDKTVYDLNWASEIYNLVNEPKKLVYIKGANHAYQGYEDRVIKKALKWFYRFKN